jgi:hypothetical protein
MYDDIFGKVLDKYELLKCSTFGASSTLPTARFTFRLTNSGDTSTFEMSPSEYVV